MLPFLAVSFLSYHECIWIVKRHAVGVTTVEVVRSGVVRRFEHACLAVLVSHSVIVSYQIMLACEFYGSSDDSVLMRKRQVCES